MSKIVYKNLKNKLEKFYSKDFAVEIGIYDHNNNLSHEKVVPLGNYIYDPMPSASEKEITSSICSRILK